MPEQPVPAAAKRAAREAAATVLPDLQNDILAGARPFRDLLRMAVQLAADEALDAAAPALREQGAAAERLVLVWRDERGGEICRSAPLTAGQARIGIPLEAQHVDLLRQDGDTT